MGVPREPSPPLDTTATLGETGEEPSLPPRSRLLAERAEDAGRRVPRRYRVLRVLGAGASAVVLECHDGVLDRRVAIKIADRGHEQAFESLVREARAVAALDHPHVVAVYEADPDAGLLVMELASRGTLDARVARSTLAALEIVALGIALAEALDAAHRAGILHRDVKPSNVLLAEDGSARLADFGVAQREADDGRAVGTRGFAAPEQLEGRASPLSDVYGLGTTLLWAATARRAAELAGESVRALVRARTGDERLARLIERMVSADPSRRPASAAEVASALRAARARSRGRWIAPLVASCVVLVAGAGAWTWHDARDARRARALDAAAEALARHDLDSTDAWLAECDPRSAEAASMRALAAWWRGAEARAVVSEIDRALELGAAPRWRDLLAGIRLLASERLDEAVAHFERYVRAYPSDLRARYGLFEALWHRGEGPAAMREHARIVERDPDFTLGIEHALVHHLARGELAEVDRVLARSNAIPSVDRTCWLARAHMARGEHGRAAAELTRLLGERSVRVPPIARQALVQARILEGDLSLARAACAGGDPVDEHLARYAIAILDDRGGADAARNELVRAIGRHRKESFVLSSMFVAIELGRGPAGDLDASLAIFDAVRKDDARTRMIDLLVASARGQEDALRAARTSTTPEVVHAADALVAAREGDLASAAAAWERAADASHDGTFRAFDLHGAATIHRERGDHQAVLRACGGVVEPPLFQWSATPHLRPCLEWMAEASAALDRHAEATMLRARLDALSR